VFKKGTALAPTFLAFAVTHLLERHFGQLVDFDFTARMEDDLDRIAAGEEDRLAWLTRFYFGDDGDRGLHRLVTEDLDAIDARAVNSIPIPGSDAVARVGRYGPYLERGDARASLPEDLAPDELTAEKAEELLAQPDNKPLGSHPETGLEIVARTGRYGPYVTEVLPEGAEGKPRTASLFASMSPETVTLEDALRLLTLPRVVGELDGEEVTAQNGRYGPYVKKGTESRSLESEEQLFTVTLDEAKALFAQPPRRRGRGASRGPLRELGEDPSSGKKIVVRDGRFGPYVTDGETNASLRRGDTVEGVTPERAAELLAERRAKSA
jgi:DNA topoisomerase I